MHIDIHVGELVSSGNSADSGSCVKTSSCRHQASVPASHMQRWDQPWSPPDPSAEPNGRHSRSLVQPGWDLGKGSAKVGLYPLNPFDQLGKPGPLPAHFKLRMRRSMPEKAWTARVGETFSRVEGRESHAWFRVVSEQLERTWNPSMPENSAWLEDPCEQWQKHVPVPVRRGFPSWIHHKGTSRSSEAQPSAKLPGILFPCEWCLYLPVSRSPCTFNKSSLSFPAFSDPGGWRSYLRRISSESSSAAVLTGCAPVENHVMWMHTLSGCCIKTYTSI